LAACPALAADVTPERLINADKEPQNWLMNHRTYDAQRFSPLGRITKDNVKNLKLAYAVAIGGTSANENLQATPLAEDGYLYVVDQWRRLQDRRPLRRCRPHRLAHGPRPGEGAAVEPRRRAVGQSRHLQRELSPTHHRHQQGQWPRGVGGEPQRRAGRAAAHRRALAVKDKIIVGAAGGDRGVRDFIAALDAATGKVDLAAIRGPGAGRAGSETWKGQEQTPGRPAAAPCG